MTALVSLKPEPTLAELEAAFADFLRLEVGDGEAARSTVRGYQSSIRAWLGWCKLMCVDPANASIADVKRYRQVLVEAGYKPATVRDLLSRVRRFYEAVCNAGLRQDNPVAIVRPPRIRTAAEDFNYLSDEELARLFSVLPDSEVAEVEERTRRLRNRLLVELMALHGLRTIEVHRANIEDVSQRGENLAMLLRGKTRDRLIYLRPDTAGRLKEYMSLCGAIPRDQLGTPLFVVLGFFGRNGRRQDGRRLACADIRKPIDKYLRLAGLKRPGISNHALRHTAPTGD